MPRALCMTQGLGIYASSVLSICYSYFFTGCLYSFILCGKQPPKLRKRFILSHIFSLSAATIGSGAAVFMDAVQPLTYTCGISSVEYKFFLYYIGVFVTLPLTVYTCYKILSLLYKEQSILQNKLVVHVIYRMAIFLCGYSSALILILLYIPSILFLGSRFNDVLDLVFAFYPSLYGLYFLCTSKTWISLRTCFGCEHYSMEGADDIHVCQDKMEHVLCKSAINTVAPLYTASSVSSTSKPYPASSTHQRDIEKGSDYSYKSLDDNYNTNSLKTPSEEYNALTGSGTVTSTMITPSASMMLMSHDPDDHCAIQVGTSTLHVIESKK